MLDLSYRGQRDSCIQKGLAAAEEGNTSLSLRLLNQLEPDDRSPLVHSYQAYCIAVEHNAIQKALILSGRALQDDPYDPLIYLNLGRIFLVAGKDEKALQAFRKGIRCQRHPLLLRKLECLGSRRRRVFPFLPRSNHLNVVSGKLFSKFS